MKKLWCLIFALWVGLAWAQSQDSEQEEALPISGQLGKVTGDATTICMDFQDANLKDVLKAFSRQTKLNFVASENVQDRKVTLYLDNVSVQDALATIIAASNLTYEQEEGSDIFVVKEMGTPDLKTVTRVFPLQYARVKGYELTVEGAKKKETKEIGIKDIIEKILTENGKAVEDARTNSLIITDVSHQFPKIEEAIKELDVKLPQVMIEAEIIETSLDLIDKLGIEWGSSTEGELLSSFGASQSVRYPFTKDSSNPRIGPEGDVSGLYMGYVSANNLGGTLAMLKKDSDTRILARPKIMTLNNESAEIKITAQTAISSLTNTSSAEGIATQTVSAERVETGVSLKVTPQINLQGEITMLIEPSITNTKASVYFDNFVDPLTRTTKTTVTVRDGQTVIIGGLIQTEDKKILRKVPFFADVPVLGNLFRKQDDQTIDTELIIFITPHLVKDSERLPELSLKQLPPEYQRLRRTLREEAMQRVLNSFEESLE